MPVGEPSPLITECPNCHTRFRVGESQLQMAHGRVRCGACLAVFGGIDHLILEESAASPELQGESDGLDSVLAELEVSAKTSTDSEAQPTSGAAGDVDWTSVSVDTGEFANESESAAVASDSSGRDNDAGVAKPAQRRATMEEALNDAEALRWWLEDELPDSELAKVGLGPTTDPMNERMVVQLSQLEEVQDEELDLKALIGANEDGSQDALEKLFREHSEEAQSQRPAEKTAAAANSTIEAAAARMASNKAPAKTKPAPAKKKARKKSKRRAKKEAKRRSKPEATQESTQESTPRKHSGANERSPRAGA